MFDSLGKDRKKCDEKSRSCTTAKAVKPEKLWTKNRAELQPISPSEAPKEPIFKGKLLIWIRR